MKVQVTTDLRSN